MAEWATYMDAHNAGFKVYPRVWVGTSSMNLSGGGAQPYPNHAIPPNGWDPGFGSYSDAFSMDEFIPKNTFNNSAGSVYSIGNYYTYSGIKPVPATLGSYSAAEWIEKVNLIFPLNPDNLYVMHYPTMDSPNEVYYSGGASGSYSVTTDGTKDSLYCYVTDAYCTSYTDFRVYLQISFGLSQYMLNDDSYERGLFTSSPPIISSHYLSVNNAWLTSPAIIEPINYSSNSLGFLITVNARSYYSGYFKVTGTIEAVLDTIYGTKSITVYLT